MPSDQESTSMSPYRVLIIGGSYAGLAAAANLLDLSEGRPPRFNPTLERDANLRYKVPVQITVVDERDGYYHLIGSPLALASEDYAEKAWVKFEDLAAFQDSAVEFKQGSVQAVDCENLTATIQAHGSSEQYEQKYDFLVAASGLRRPWPVVPQSLTRAEYLNEAQTNIDATKAAKDGVVIIGGGAVGVEMAAELKMVQPDTKVTLIHSRDKLLSAEPLPDEFKDAIAPLVRSAGVELILNARVNAVTPSPTDPNTRTLTLSNNTILTASHVITAISKSTPTTNYLPASALDTEGHVKIAPTLHFTSDLPGPHARAHFAVGDIAAWSGIKRCGAAMHMGHYAAYNIHQTLLARLHSDRDYTPKFLSLAEHPPMIGLAVGRNAVTYGPADGVKSGEEVERLMFGGDLGWTICWRYLRLGERKPAAAPEVEEAEKTEVVDAREGLRKLEFNEPERLEELPAEGRRAVVVASAA